MEKGLLYDDPHPRTMPRHGNEGKHELHSLANFMVQVFLKEFIVAQIVKKLPDFMEYKDSLPC
jgi:hypothetical protein